MKLEDFDYELPPGRIAQEPTEERDASRLMFVRRASGGIEHGVFRDLPGRLREGDLLVLNDSRVLPARLLALKPGGGMAEVLFLERLESAEGRGIPVGSAAGEERGSSEKWSALVRGFPRGEHEGFEFPGGLRIRLEGREPDGEVARVIVSPRGGVDAALERAGMPPLPLYIRREPGDPRLAAARARYQTVYAASPGAVAAPTAGLHFTERLLAEIRRRGVSIGTLTLHVGWGTFQPVRAERLEDHRMHAERYTIPESLAAAIEEARRRGSRVVAVGTTVVRALEHAARVDAARGEADLFILPGHRFRVVDGLITNFHLPRSTLLVLVCAFAGRERILAAYAEAIRRGYRFYSYGDAMGIL